MRSCKNINFFFCRNSSSILLLVQDFLFWVQLHDYIFSIEQNNGSQTQNRNLLIFRNMKMPSYLFISLSLYMRNTLLMTSILAIKLKRENISQVQKKLKKKKTMSSTKGPFVAVKQWPPQHHSSHVHNLLQEREITMRQIYTSQQMNYTGIIWPIKIPPQNRATSS